MALIPVIGIFWAFENMRDVATEIATGRRTKKENEVWKEIGVATIIILENYGKP